MPEHTTTPSQKKRISSRRQGVRLTAKQRQEAQEQFLKSFAANGNVRAACMQANVDRSTVYHWQEHDETFSLRYNLAKEDVNDAIRAEIYRRAMFGEERFVTSMGKIVYKDVPAFDAAGKPIMKEGKQVMLHGEPLTIREKSDTLLMFHAKSRMPEYREKQPDVNVNAQITLLAEQAKTELLADLEAALNYEAQEPPH